MGRGPPKGMKIGSIVGDFRENEVEGQLYPGPSRLLAAILAPYKIATHPY